MSAWYTKKIAELESKLVAANQALLNTQASITEFRSHLQGSKFHAPENWINTSDVQSWLDLVQNATYKD